jgi:hypothetical protein
MPDLRTYSGGSPSVLMSADMIREQKISFLLGMTAACENKTREEVGAWLDNYEGRL